ncbi:MAG: hypothetical protein ACKVQW_12025 [Pyrinomonadaceae bacterium]
MKKLIVSFVVVCAAFQLVNAQKSSPDAAKREIRELRREMLREMKKDNPTTVDAGASAVSADDVGEADSFDKGVKFMGIAGSGVMYVYHSCDPAILLAELDLVLGPDDRCLAAPNPAVTATATFVDIARINLPARANRNVLYMINNHSINWDFSNAGPGVINGQMSYSPRITIESDALNDPAAIDPNTNLPMNGSYTTTGNGSKFMNMSLQPSTFNNYVESYSRANTTGLSRHFFANLGLPTNVIDNLFNRPMTIRLGGRISVRGVGFGQFLYSARFLGN